MKITFFSNFLNHHQLPICLEFIKHVGKENFHFVSCEQIHVERVNMGYEDMNTKYSFVIRIYESEENMIYAKKLAKESEVAIIGSAPIVFSEIRAAENKLTFLFRERIFKNGTWHRFYPPIALNIYKNYTRYRNKNFYILCASAYAANDFNLCGFPRAKCLKWGYFPEFKENVELDRHNKKLMLMWCGRMIWWKHPAHAVEVARMLKERNIDFELLMVGNGDKETEVKNLIIKYNLSQNISLRNFMSVEDIRKKMELSDIYIFSSGKQEGWGVVLNEAMNSACTIIANIHAGSTAFLMKDTVTGFIYDGSIKTLEQSVVNILEADISQMGKNSYTTIRDNWTPQHAVKYLLNFINGICLPDLQTPCSKA